VSLTSRSSPTRKFGAAVCLLAMLAIILNRQQRSLSRLQRQRAECVEILLVLRSRPHPRKYSFDYENEDDDEDDCSIPTFVFSRVSRRGRRAALRRVHSWFMLRA
jgi:hypothetical protein